MTRLTIAPPSSSTAWTPRACAALVLLAIGAAGIALAAAEKPKTFVVAHRGASAYAPEHTKAAYELAIAQGADYIEPDLGITKDGILVCLHDWTLERTTNVATVFPTRFTEATENGQTVKHWYLEEFTLAEIKTLDAGATFDPKFAGERVLTFQEAIEIARGKAGVFPELKGAVRLQLKGIDLTAEVVRVLKASGLLGATVRGVAAVDLQSFEDPVLRRLAKELPDAPRSFLIGSPASAKRWMTDEGYREMRTFATGVAPAKGLVTADPGSVSRAHAAGLTVVPWTFETRLSDAQLARLPEPYRETFTRANAGKPDSPAGVTAEIRTFVEQYKVDGLFTNNPDLFPR